MFLPWPIKLRFETGVLEHVCPSLQSGGRRLGKYELGKLEMILVILHLLNRETQTAGDPVQGILISGSSFNRVEIYLPGFCISNSEQHPGFHLHYWSFIQVNKLNKERVITATVLS